MLAHQSSNCKLQSCSPSRPRLGRHGFGAHCVLVNLLILACGRNYWPSFPALTVVALSSWCYRLNTSIGETYATFSRDASGNWQQAPGLCFLLCALLILILLLKVKAACILAHVLTCGACCACPCPAAGRAPLMLTLCVSSSVSHLNL